MKSPQAAKVVLAALLQIAAAGSSSGEREDRLAALNQIGMALQSSLMKGDPGEIGRICLHFEVDVGVDDFIGCDEVARALESSGDYLYCRVLDTACYREKREAIAERLNSADLRAKARIAQSTRDIFRKAGAGLKVQLSFSKTRDVENLDEAVIVYFTPELPRSYGDTGYPYVRLSFWKTKWVLTALFPEI